MRYTSNAAGLAFSMLLVVVLALPTIRWVTQTSPRNQLYGYTDNVPSRPISLVGSFFNKTLQRWVERYFDVNLGFRESMIRSFNEINFDFFREAPRLRLVSTRDHGLYSTMSIDSLNDEILNKTTLEKKYYSEAYKLLQVQQFLASQGKYFEVVIATSKPYVYPKGLGTRFLVGGDQNIFERAASFGNVLRSVGVNVIDSGPYLRQIAEKTGIATHPNSGVHWNYYSGCKIATKIFDNARLSGFLSAPIIDCGHPQRDRPQMVDLDGYLLLNIWSGGDLLKLSTYPTITPVKYENRRPSVVFIGDSFSDQIRYALQQANAYSKLVTSGYFRSREVEDKANNRNNIEGLETDESDVRAKLFADIAASDIIILQMVDYNVSRLGYGFADYFLAKHADKRGEIQIASVTGAYGRETDRENWWHWVEHKVSFKLQPLFVPKDTTQTKLHFEYGTRGKQMLTLRIIKRDGSIQKIMLQSKGDAIAMFEKVIDLPSSELAEISIETDGKASPLGNGDSRIAAWIIRNLSINSVSP